MNNKRKNFQNDRNNARFKRHEGDSRRISSDPGPPSDMNVKIENYQGKIIGSFKNLVEIVRSVIKSGAVGNFR